jgi:hypothetical protein
MKPAEDPAFEVKVSGICTIYCEAPARAVQGERTMVIDEPTGVQALECSSPGLPMVPGKIERRELAYIGHGTATFILSRDVVRGQIVAPTAGTTRTEADFLAHIQRKHESRAHTKTRRHEDTKARRGGRRETGRDGLTRRHEGTKGWGTKDGGRGRETGSHEMLSAYSATATSRQDQRRRDRRDQAIG